MLRLTSQVVENTIEINLEDQAANAAIKRLLAAAKEILASDNSLTIEQVTARITATRKQPGDKRSYYRDTIENYVFAEFKFKFKDNKFLEIAQNAAAKAYQQIKIAKALNELREEAKDDTIKTIQDSAIKNKTPKNLIESLQKRKAQIISSSLFDRFEYHIQDDDLQKLLASAVRTACEQIINEIPDIEKLANELGYELLIERATTNKLAGTIEENLTQRLHQSTKNYLAKAFNIELIPDYFKKMAEKGLQNAGCNFNTRIMHAPRSGLLSIPEELKIYHEERKREQELAKQKKLRQR